MSESAEKTKATKNSYKSEGSTKFMRLKALDCFEEVLQMLRYGYTRKRIAQYIQDEQGEYTDVTQDSLIRMLNRFTKQEFHRYEKSVDKTLPSQEELPAEDEEQALERKEKQDKLNVIDEYSSLYQLQRDRIDRAVRRERKSDGLLMKEIGKEIRIAAEILNDLGQYQQDVGILPRQAKQIDVNVGPQRQLSEPQSSAAEKIADNPSRRGRVLEFLKVTNQIEGDSLESIENDEDEDVIDANYEVKESDDD